MSLRDFDIRAWALVGATLGSLAAFALLIVGGFHEVPILVGLALATPILALFTIWYLYDVAYRREVRRRYAAEATTVPQMATAEALLRILDHASSLLDRLTRYTGWFFFFIVLAIFIVSALFSIAVQALAWAGPWLGVVLGVLQLAFWAAYFYYYYKIKHENDIWKERIAWLRERERQLLGQ